MKLGDALAVYRQHFPAEQKLPAHVEGFARQLRSMPHQDRAAVAVLERAAAEDYRRMKGEFRGLPKPSSGPTAPDAGATTRNHPRTMKDRIGPLADHLAELEQIDLAWHDPTLLRSPEHYARPKLLDEARLTIGAMGSQKVGTPFRAQIKNYGKTFRPWGDEEKLRLNPDELIDIAQRTRARVEAATTLVELQAPIVIWNANEFKLRLRPTRDEICDLAEDYRRWKHMVADHLEGGPEAKEAYLQSVESIVAAVLAKDEALRPVPPGTRPPVELLRSEHQAVLGALHGKGGVVLAAAKEAWLEAHAKVVQALESGVKPSFALAAGYAEALAGLRKEAGGAATGGLSRLQKFAQRLLREAPDR
jgi:hypothetical protein